MNTDRPSLDLLFRLAFAFQMPVGSIPAITGKLRKRLILDLTVALGGGTALGYGYWCVYPCNIRLFRRTGDLCLLAILRDRLLILSVLHSLSLLCILNINRYGVHIPSVSRRDAFYAKLQAERTE